MNEPGIDVFFAFVGVVAGVMLVPALLTAVCARWSDAQTWNACRILIPVACGVAALWIITRPDIHPGSTEPVVAISFVTFASTALAAWITGRLRRRVPVPSFLGFAKTAAVSQIVSAFALIMVTWQVITMIAAVWG